MQTKKAIMVLGVALTVAGGCEKTKINPNDSSKPSAEVKVRASGGGEYKAMSETTLSTGGSLDLMCIITDPQGVKSAFLGFSGHSDNCTVGSSFYSGGFSIKTMPTNLNQQLQGDAQGNVITSLPILSDLNGPFTCSVYKPPCTQGDACSHGAPITGVITVTCSGENWSANAQNQKATATLKITLQ